MLRNSILVLLTLCISACSSTGGIFSGGSEQSARISRYNAETAKMLCDVDALAQEKAAVQSTVDQTRRNLMGQTAQQEDSETLLADKLYRYEAELEASYRNVTSSCTLYASCMQTSSGQCGSSREQWNSASERFSDLIVDIREISAEVEIERIRAQRPRIIVRDRGRGRGGDRGRGGYDRDCRGDCCGDRCKPKSRCDCDHDPRDCRDRDCDCKCHGHPPRSGGCTTKCEVINSIFTTGCCR